MRQVRQGRSRQTSPRGRRAYRMPDRARMRGLYSDERAGALSRRRPLVLIVNRQSVNRQLSTSSLVSSAAMRSERRNRRSLEVISRFCAGVTRAVPLRHRRRVLVPAGKADNRLERHAHLVACRPRAFATGLHLRVVGRRRSDCVGKLSGEPVDVVHPGPLLTAAGPGTAAFSRCVWCTPGGGPGNRGHLISGGWIFVKDAAILRADQCDVNEQAPHDVGVTPHLVPNMMTFSPFPQSASGP